MPAMLAVLVIAALVTIAPTISIVPAMIWAMSVLPLALYVVGFAHAHGIEGEAIDKFPIYLTWAISGALVVIFAWRWWRERRRRDFNLLVLSIGLPAAEMWGLKLVAHSFAGG